MASSKISVSTSLWCSLQMANCECIIALQMRVIAFPMPMLILTVMELNGMKLVCLHIHSIYYLQAVFTFSLLVGGHAHCAVKACISANVIGMTDLYFIH